MNSPRWADLGSGLINSYLAQSGLAYVRDAAGAFRSTTSLDALPTPIKAALLQEEDASEDSLASLLVPRLARMAFFPEPTRRQEAILVALTARSLDVELSAHTALHRVCRATAFLPTVVDSSDLAVAIPFVAHWNRSHYVTGSPDGWPLALIDRNPGDPAPAYRLSVEFWAACSEWAAPRQLEGLVARVITWATVLHARWLALADATSSQLD